ncbi:MAG: PSD1 and planctomycete cytochrome C domain-containing protein [Planctomycetota bacterium]
MQRAIGQVIGCVLCIGVALGCFAADSDVPEIVRFNRDVRPILSNNCFYCHGPDEKKRSAKLRLDEFAGATADHQGTRAVVPGHPEQSELIKRLTTTDPEELMPPPKSQRPALTATQVAILKKWIEQGAKYEGHWAFVPLSSDAPPPVKNAVWVKNPIDAFILSRLEKERITPSPEADRVTLLRRATLDLTGLLPTPEEVAAFVADTAPDAYEKRVNALLANPHFGERWGRHWLDQARYADSNGYSVDSDRTMWPYRDWVIKAFNDDLPFDRFTIEQLAGDLLPKPAKNQLIATAFHRNTLINEEGGVDKEQFRNEAVVDRVNTTGAVWLGLTVGCAQCHSHKFDPIAQREYYELFAFFNHGTDVNNKGETISVARGEVFGTPYVPSTHDEPKPEPAVAALSQAEWEKQELARITAAVSVPATTGDKPVAWIPAHFSDYDTASGAGFELLPDGSLLSDGRGAFNDTYRVVAKTDLKRVAAVRLRVLTHEKLPHSGPGMASNGNFVLTDFTATVDGKEHDFDRASADHEQPNFPAKAAIDSDHQSGWAINAGKNSKTKMNANHEAVFVFSKPIDPTGKTVEFKLHHGLNEHYLVGRFAIDFSESAPGAATTEKPADGLADALKTPAIKRTAAHKKVIKEAFDRIEKTASPKKQTQNPNVAELMIMKELAKPRPTYIQTRGDFLRKDEVVGLLNPGGLSAVPPALHADATRTRMDLAKWLVDTKNPLTPRVTVNRMWMRCFGRGLVETDEDFGTQGAPPTHPELLDFLARTFVENGWSTKSMLRLIMTSATYRQSSKARPELNDIDARNLLLARQNRVRVEAEIVRDVALTASGMLDPTIGGPSVRPPQPEGVYAFTQNVRKWTADVGGNRYRRAMYTRFYRSAPHPLFSTFDTPDFQTVCTRRVRSNTPLQALMVANDAAFVELAQGFATRLLKEVPGADSDARIRRAFVLSLCREPSAKEFAALSSYFKRQSAEFAKDASAAQALLSPDLKASKTDPAQAAALVCVARAIFNTDAFITRE